MIRVVIVDDHAIVREGLRFLFEQQSDIEVVSEGEDGLQAIALIEEQHPDVLLLDLLMPKLHGVEVIRQIKRLSPQTQILVLTSYSEDELLFGAIQAGALSYLLKDTRPQDLVAAVRAAAKGESILHPLIAKRVLREMRQTKRSSLQDLTARERDVLTRIARGRSNREIAADLCLGEQTIKTHVSNILAKLHLADRTQAAIYALQQRLVPLDETLNQED
ncbi:response regulator [Dictyobacter arantiisoli]|uniref:DNA-binding response regulator n=1 Tax=Dictyobacter arantiisoli TaxID=2014874 RepID=A0A5A5TFH5_9CHLR|nr:response regulator transcription factor [Dictyobacter arantiisoli]GCF09813.1 DNA-binding response regulator [Dictyobacter arantiisoli]